MTIPTVIGFSVESPQILFLKYELNFNIYLEPFTQGTNVL